MNQGIDYATIRSSNYRYNSVKLALTMQNLFHKLALIIQGKCYKVKIFIKTKKYKKYFTHLFYKFLINFKINILCKVFF